jgi:hypothetical protein
LALVIDHARGSLAVNRTFANDLPQSDKAADFCRFGWIAHKTEGLKATTAKPAAMTWFI